MSDWLQVGAFVVTLVWGAATVKSELRHVREDLDDFKSSVKEATATIATTLHNHGERISRIEGKLGS